MINSIGFIIQERYLNDPYPKDFINFCKKKNINVELLVPEFIQKNVSDIDLKSDIYIHRNHSELGLALLSKAEKQSNIINSFQSVLYCQNKNFMLSILSTDSNINLPKIHFILKKQDIKEDMLPIIIKPILGNNGEGIYVIKTEEQLQALDNLDFKQYIVQEFIENDGYDIKLYCIDKNIFAVKKSSPISDNNVSLAIPINIESHFFHITKKIREITGLNIFGIDLLKKSDDKYYILDINECSSFSSIPNLNCIMLNAIENLVFPITRY